MGWRGFECKLEVGKKRCRKEASAILERDRQRGKRGRFIEERQSLENREVLGKNAEECAKDS
jgi:hypothetical protein